MGKWFHRASEIENLRAELKRQAYLIDKLRGQLRSAGLIDESSTSADAVEESLARTGQTIEAVKRYRERTGATLEESKKVIDSIR